MKKDIIISIAFGLFLLGLINAFLGIRESPLLQSVNIDIVMTSLSLYVFFVTISQMLHKDASQDKKELNNKSDMDCKEKNKIKRGINRKTTFARFSLISSVVATILFMILLTSAPIENMKMVSNTSTLITMSFFFFFIGFYEKD